MARIDPIQYRELLLTIEGGEPLVVEKEHTEKSRLSASDVELGLLPGPVVRELYVRPAENAWHELGVTYRATLGWQGREPDIGEVRRVDRCVYRFRYVSEEVPDA